MSSLDAADRGLRVTLVLFVALTSLAPILWVLLSSFKTNDEILSSALSFPSSVSFDAYGEVFERTRFLRFLFNSLFVSTVSTVAAVALFGMAAYVLARFEFRGKRLIYVLLISSILISLLPMQQPILKVVRTLGLFDSVWALILVHTARGLPVVIFIMHSFFRTIPREMQEAAAIDGAGFFRTYASIMLPLAAPAAISSAVLVFLNAYNDFLFSLLLTQSEESRTLSYSLRFFVSLFSFDFPTLFAAITMTLAPSVLVYLLLQEQIRRGLAGGVKG